MTTIKEQIERAQVEVASWAPEKLKNVQRKGVPNFSTLPKLSIGGNARNPVATISGGNGYDTIDQVIAQLDKSDDFQVRRDVDTLYSGDLNKLNVHATYLTSLIGFNFAFDTLSLWDNKLITSLEGLQMANFRRLDIDTVNFTTLQNCHKQLPKCLKALHTQQDFESHMLGLLHMQNLTALSWRPLRKDGVGDRPFKTAAAIIGTHLLNEHDLIECKEELMTAGLKDYAKL